MQVIVQANILGYHRGDVVEVDDEIIAPYVEGGYADLVADEEADASSAAGDVAVASETARAAVREPADNAKAQRAKAAPRGKPRAT